MNSPLQPALNGLEPKLVLHYFNDICQIARPSHKEEGVRVYLRAKAKEHNWATKEDKAGNIVLYVPARGSGSKAPTLIVQGHMDMVCVKRKDKKHDFDKDPISLRLSERSINGKSLPVIEAHDTTLGADNGIGVATALALATDSQIKDCPALELLFTVAEEVGLVGAKQLDGSMLKGEQLLNLDTFEVTQIIVGCASGSRYEVRWDGERAAAPSSYVCISVTIDGLPGGHSGINIHEDRPSAIDCFRRAIPSDVPLLLSHLRGGDRANAIASNLEATIWCQKDSSSKVLAAFSAQNAPWADYGKKFPKFRLSAQALNAEGIAPPFSAETSGRIFCGLSALPQGIKAWSKLVPDMVETSSNIGTIESDTRGISISGMTRSSVEGEIEKIHIELDPKLSALGAKHSYESSASESWTTDPEGAFIRLARDIFKKTRGCEPEIKAVHATDECGAVASRVGRKLQMFSCGPQILDAHSADESLVIPSISAFWSFVKAFVIELANAPVLR